MGYSAGISSTSMLKMIEALNISEIILLTALCVELSVSATELC